MKKAILTVAFCVFAFLSNAQRFYLGDKLSPSSDRFEALGGSSKTGVYSYRYTMPINDQMYKRRIGDIVLGIKNGIIVTTIYNLIPENTDVGVPEFMIQVIEEALGYPLKYVNGTYGVNVDNTSFTISRKSDVMTFHKDRISIFSSVKNSVLSNN